MRVVCLLLLLGCSMLGVSSQYVTDGTTTTAGWIFTGVQSGATNPTLNLTAGNTYNFTVTATSATSPQHPFNFSSAANKGATTLAALDTTLYSVSPSAECTTLNNGYLGNGCVVSLTIANGAAGQSIYYKCTFHGDMTGTINITAAATTTAPTATPTPTPTVPAGNATATPTVPAGNATTAPTTPAGNATNAPTTPAGNATNAPTPTATPTAAPTQITGATLSGNAFHITGANGTAGYIFTVNNQQYLNPTLNITAGTDWTISIEFANTLHPFGFSPNGTTSAVALSQAFFPDWLNNISVTNFATCNAPNNGVWVVKANATTPSTSPCVLGVHTDSSYAGKQLYYRCGSHAAMVGTINFVAAAATPAPSSTGRGNTASTVTGAGLALVMALLTAFIKA